MINLKKWPEGEKWVKPVWWNMEVASYPGCAKVERVKKLLSAAYPGCTISESYGDDYQGTGPDGWWYYVRLEIEGVWQHTFGDFEYDASAHGEADPAWDRIQADNLDEFNELRL